MPEREVLELDVVFVGAGPACLAAALNLKNLLREHDELVEKKVKPGRVIGDVEIGVIEKGATVGAHILSGAVMDPVAIRELVPDFLDRGCPVDTVVTEDKFWYLTEGGKISSPITPPPLVNKGKYILSLSKFCEWLAELCEEAGVNIFPEFPGSELLYDGEDRIIGVRTGDKGVDKHGNPKPNFEPGVDLHAKITVLGEGSRGSLTKQVVERLNLDEGKEPTVYSLGIKELWEVPDGNIEEGFVVHTLGYPSDSRTYGGGWIYGMKDNMVSIGYVTGLDYEDPLIDPHSEFQAFKTHPAVSKILAGGKMVKYGAKSINAGGYNTMPRLYADGLLLIGDSASFLNGQRIKGIHTAMKSGMIAAEAIVTALDHEDYSTETLSLFEDKFNMSWIYDELYPVRNFHSSFQKGRWSALINTGLQFVTGGRAWGFLDKEYHVAGHERMKRLSDYDGDRPGGRYPELSFDKQLTFDKITDVFHAAVGHEEDQPSHLHILDTEICATRCVEEYGNPCVKFCPAAVYEMEHDDGTGREEIKVNFSNCVHCKTCDIADPYQIINWVTPEGGGGPNYQGM